LIIAGALAAIWFTFAFGQIDGWELSPESIERRSFHYVEIPLLHIQILPLRHKNLTGPIERQLVADGIVSRATHPRWDLVAFSRNLTTDFEGDAMVLWRYLAAEDASGQLYWLNWTNVHPEHAKLIWPAVYTAARQRLYMLIPPIMELAGRNYDAPELRVELDQLLARRYAELAQIHRELGAAEFADQLLAEARAHQP
jgi:hypothetical protein